jgi:ubiquinone/menaquinone biosynthesis C-methylase UbiE
MTEKQKFISDTYESYGPSHWYIQGRYDIILHMYRNLDLPRSSICLDAGSGTGTLAKRLRDELGITIYEVDDSPYSEENSHRNKWFFTGDIKSINLPDNSYDCIFCIDVLEHIHKPEEALTELHRILRPNGYLILSVPSHMCLWGAHDELAGHVTRFNRKEVINLLRSTQYHTVFVTYQQLLLFIPLWIFRKIKKLNSKKNSDFFMPPTHINNALRTLIQLEKYLIGKIKIPFGINLIGVAKK